MARDLASLVLIHFHEIWLTILIWQFDFTFFSKSFKESSIEIINVALLALAFVGAALLNLGRCLLAWLTFDLACVSCRDGVDEGVSPCYPSLPHKDTLPHRYYTPVENTQLCTFHNFMPGKMHYLCDHHFMIIKSATFDWRIEIWNIFVEIDYLRWFVISLLRNKMCFSQSADCKAVFIFENDLKFICFGMEVLAYLAHAIIWS